jgi:hypothetical protein
MEPRFGADFSAVRVHTGSDAVQMNRELGAQAFAHGSDVYFGAGKSPGNNELTAHELTHVVQQTGNGKSGQSIQAAPIVPIAIWLGKAALATTIDAFIDFAIAALTGSAPPGFLDHLGNFVLNVIPGAGEAKKLKKIAKFIKVLDDIATAVKALERIPGGKTLVKEVSQHINDLKKAVQGGDLDAAKGIFNNVLGKFREAQIAVKLEANGATVKHLGRKLKDPGTGRILTDIDVVTEEAGKQVYNQIKGGKNALNIKPTTKTGAPNNAWLKFEKQAEETLKQAQKDGASVTYYVDDISEEARKRLQELASTYKVPLNIKNSGEFLR